MDIEIQLADGTWVPLANTDSTSPPCFSSPRRCVNTSLLLIYDATDPQRLRLTLLDEPKTGQYVDASC
ncbi:hypothetical protein [Burkholderia territorii]|uniref:hypothetical protein n=1 Tax=Burkholderia territorii TaxID=1503055 RepID=UPI000AF44669|nr:hypothetical protein [Burkholderia territorii]